MRMRDIIKVGFGLGVGFMLGQATVGSIALMLIKPGLNKKTEKTEESTEEGSN